MGHTREAEKRAGDFLYAGSLRSQRGFARAVPAAPRPVPGNVAAAVGHETGDNSGRPQTPPDLVVKFQHIDIVDVLLW